MFGLLNDVILEEIWPSLCFLHHMQPMVRICRHQVYRAYRALFSSLTSCRYQPFPLSSTDKAFTVQKLQFRLSAQSKFQSQDCSAELLEWWTLVFFRFFYPGIRMSLVMAPMAGKFWDHIDFIKHPRSKYLPSLSPRHRPLG